MSFGQWANDYLGVPLEERFNFNPLTYFLYSGIDGAWLDPEDTSTMYQDSAGTTPVTTMEQPVGLWLDKSHGLELGPELNLDNSFNNPAYWIVDSGVSVSGGNANFLGTGTATSAVYKSGIVTIGKSYLVTYTVTSYTSGAHNPVIGSTSAPQRTGDGVFSAILVVTGNSNIALRSGSGIFTVSDFSVREIKGNHATQSITASRPTLSARYNLLLNSATLSTQSVTTVAAQYTLSFTGTGSVTLSGTATGTLAGTGANNRVSLSFTPTAGTLTLTVTGSVTLAMLAFGTLTTYQAITTATSYDSVGWSRYVRFDGIDDYLNLPYMGLYANGSASVILPMSSSRVADVYSRIIAETSAVNSGPCYILPREDLNTTGTDIQITTDSAAVILSTSVVPFTNEQINIRSYVDSGSNVKTFADSSIKQSVDYTRSGVLTLNSTLIGAQATPTGVNAFAAIKLYGLIITKSALSDTDRRRCEQFLASRLSTLGVTLS